MPFVPLRSASCLNLSVEDPVTVRPQVVVRDSGAEEVHPERWGITLGQCRELMRECRRDPRWDPSNNVHTLVKDYVIPMTAGKGLGYALLQNEAEPREVNVMVSHAWSENAEEFFKTLQRSVAEEDVMFICSLSIYQCEDGAGPSINEQIGFRRVVEHIAELRRASWLARTWHVWQWLSWLLLMLAVAAYFTVVRECLPVTGSMCAVGTVVGHDARLYHGSYCLLPRLRFRLRKLGTAEQCLVVVSVTCLCISMALSLLLSLLDKRGRRHSSRRRRSGAGSGGSSNSSSSSESGSSCGSSNSSGDEERAKRRTPVFPEAYRGFLLVVPNYECDLYSRLWCVYEIYVAVGLGVPCLLARTLASAGRIRCESATCSLKEDQDRITWEIKSGGGFEAVDAAVRSTLRHSRYSFLRALLQYLMPYLTMSLAVPGGDWAPAPQLWGTVLCTGVYSVTLASIVLHVGSYVLVKRQAGKVTYRSALTWAGVVSALGLSLRAVEYFYLKDHAPPLRRSGLRDFPPFHHCFTFALVSGGFSMLVLICLEKCCCGRFLHWPHRSLALKLLLPLTLAALGWYAADVRTATQYEASVIWYLSFRLAPYAGFFAYFWTAAALWGVQLV